MPELPEVETTRRGIKSYLVGNKIKYSIVRNRRLRFPVAIEILNINNELILNIKRRAKYLLFELKYGWIIIHLGMSGNLQILTKKQLALKHDHIDLVLADGKILRYTDPRRFGFWLWANNLHNHPLMIHLGPEPLSNNFNVEYLCQRAKNKKTAIKPWLMDNKIVVGLGNIYTNEILLASKILPTRIVKSLNKKEITNLVIQIKYILNSAIEYGGTTLKNFLQFDGKPGFFNQKLLIYGKKNEHCTICNQKITLIKQRNRSTYFCYNCQK
ncbi:Formamidopyrimidine-DNA glycosylase [Candidatus Arsenophonus lipoptenae]|uniref:Formamidopyrimidine-DNA glycosylase n=1 Tax=Candidatus Arsenophonus lipoptenae TaxID=634113 RepID=A0A0X9VDS0_9GAMM|nr:bifunctional DNA-formamidopyrimidine glycosylase/DNA-(apurinic or apyrimidinic site) lyase [Candidatus Arsenophonus lipoptenae]AMA64719.1 Formamidopyrimidine-DNA glycosylase [Candidatus Arsenophonus lipoptenae]